MNIPEIIIECMYRYGKGESNLSDKEYDDLLSKLPKYHILRNITWDMVQNLFPELNPYKYEENKVINPYYSIIPKFGIPKSILTINSNNKDYLYTYLSEIINYCYINKIDFDLILSLKMDGWNIRNYYKDELFLSHTRNTDLNNIIETTELMKSILPNLTNLKKEVAVTGELVLKKSSLPTLRNKYQKRFSNVRNSVSSFVHNKMSKEDYKYCDFFAFNLVQEEGSIYYNILDTYLYLKSKGFTTPPYIQCKVCYEENYERFFDNCSNSFLSSFNKIEDYYANKFSLLYECDGVVVQPNNSVVRDIFNTQQHLNGGLIALKIGYWGQKVYSSKVIRMYFTKSRTTRALMLEIEPTDTGFGTITKVDIDNVSRALQYDIEVGDNIEFSVHSNQDIQFFRNLK